MLFSVAGGDRTQVEKLLNGEVVGKFKLFLRVPPKTDPMILRSEEVEGTWFWDYITTLRND